MSASIGYHPLVQKDLNEILAYYESEVGPEVADRFESEFRFAIAAIRDTPRHFSFYQSQRIYRRCLLASFPHTIREYSCHSWFQIFHRCNTASQIDSNAFIDRIARMRQIFAFQMVNFRCQRMQFSTPPRETLLPFNIQNSKFKINHIPPPIPNA